MIGKKYLQKLLDANLSFVYLWCCEEFNFTGTYEEFCVKYKNWLKVHNTPKNDINKRGK